MRVLWILVLMTWRFDTTAHTNLYSGQVEGAVRLFGNSIDNGNIAANIRCSNCDHKSFVKEELLSNFSTQSVDDETNSNCDTKEKVDDEINSDCDICSIENKSGKLGGMSSISLNFVNYDHRSQPFVLKMFLWHNFSSEFYIWRFAEFFRLSQTFKIPNDLVNFVRQTKLCCGKHTYMYNLFPFPAFQF